MNIFTHDDDYDNGGGGGGGSVHYHKYIISGMEQLQKFGLI